jgi:hypothetical protein
MARTRLTLLAVAVTTVLVGPARAQLCAPSDDPCVVSSSTAVPGGTIVDLGTRAFVVASGVTITVRGTGNGSFVLTAGDVTFQDGAHLVAGGVNGTGGDVSIKASGAVVMRANSRIDVTAGAGGSVTMVAASAKLNGELRAVATLSDGDGGTIDLETAGDLTIGGGGIIARGGDGYGFGGFVYPTAGGSIEIAGPIEAKGGDGGDVDFEALGDLRVTADASVNNVATAAGNDGGDVTFGAGGLVSIAGSVVTTGRGSLVEGGGCGGDVDVTGEQVILAGNMDLSGAGPDGDGGYFDANANGDLTVTGPIVSDGAAEGVGGEADLTAGGTVSVESSFHLRGGYMGGAFSVRATGSAVFASTASIDAKFEPGFALGGHGGIITIDACDVTIPAGAVLSCAGSGTAPVAYLEASAGSSMTIGGTLTAGSQVLLRYRGQPPTILGSAIIQPMPTIQEDPTVPCCVMCTTTTSASSTTSTSSIFESTTTTMGGTSTSLTFTSTVTFPSTSTSSSSSTVTTAVSSSTTTTLQPACLDEPLQGYAAIECAVASLQDMVRAQGDEALGGRKSARRLAGKIAKTWSLVETARTSAKPARPLLKAEKKIVSFESQIARLLAKAKIPDALATELLDLSGQVTLRIDDVRLPLTT